MRKALLFNLVFGLSTTLLAYGVSPNQYLAGQAADANKGLPIAPQPMPLAPGQQPAQIQAQPQAAGGPVDYNAMGDPAWATAWKHYTWEQALALWNGKKALFCDARSKMEYDQGHIPGAIPLPLSEFDKYYALYTKQIKAAHQLVTYCHGAGCQLSNKVAQKLWQKNYRNVGSFFGGWPQWQEHNMPVQSGGTPEAR